MYLAVDIGSSSLKMGVIGEEGQLLSYGRSFFPDRDYRKFSADRWVDALLELKPFYEDYPLEAVSISSNGPTLVPLDSRGEPLFPALFWQDGREILLKGPSYYLPKVEWFRRKHPELYEKTDLFLSPSEYLLYLMTGQASMACSDHRFQPFLWDEEQLMANSFRREKFPPFLAISEGLGVVNKLGAKRFGLSQGTPCFVMGSDFQASLLGTASVTPGMVCDRAGSSEGLNFCTERSSKSKYFRDLPHVISPLWNAASILSSTGSLFEWYRSLTHQDKVDYEDLLEKIIGEKEADHLYFFPTLKHGGLWEFSGGMLLGLDPYHGSSSMGRAMLESIGFSLRHGLDLLEKRLGKAKSIVLCGGQAKNPLWNQMKADLTGRSLVLPEVVDAELLGCAIASSKGLGIHKSLKEASQKLFRPEREISPRLSGADHIECRYRRYLKISKRVKSFYRKKLKIELDKK